MKKKVYKEKIIKNYKLYFLAHIFEELCFNLQNYVSDETNELLKKTKESIIRDVDHLKADNLTATYILECGYDYL